MSTRWRWYKRHRAHHAGNPVTTILILHMDIDKADTPRRLIIVVALCIGLAGAAVAVRMLVRSSAGHQNAASVAATPDQRRDLLRQSLQAIEDGLRESPRDRWDADYVVTAIGRDPQELAAWVRTSTYWIPYRGELRGAAGVLMDGQGNSLDRAVLLATLLQKAGHRVRLAHRELTRDQTLDLMPRLARRRSDAFAVRPVAPLIGADALRHATAQYHLGAADVEISAARESFARATAEAKARVTDQSGRLLKAISRREAASDWGRRFNAAVDAMRDHWWVQRAVDDHWLDVDVIDPDDRSHSPIATASETIPLEAAPLDGRSHELTVRVIAERWSPNGLSERRALEHVIRPHEVIGQPLVLQFLPTDALLKAGSNEPADPATPRDSWSILLLTGTDVTAVGALQANGDDPDVSDLGGFGGLGGAIVNSLGTKPAARVSELSAVWIEYEIRTPGQPSETIRRMVFDLIGPAARAASPTPALAMDDGKTHTRQANLTMRTEMLPIVCRVAPEFVAYLAARALLGNRHLLDAATDTLRPKASADRLAQPAAPTVSGLYALALARAVWSHRPGILFDERISLFTNHIFPGASDGRPALFEATDIVTSHSGVDLNERDGFASRLEQGVLDTNVESLIRIDQEVTGNAGTAFNASTSWAAVEGSDAMSRLTLSPDIKRRVQNDLAGGYLVVAPTAAIPDGRSTFEGWWRVDPTTGDALGFGPHGWGEAQPITERSPQQSWLTRTAPLWKKMGKRFASVFVASYLWCVGPIGQANLNRVGFNLGALRATVVESYGECVGDSLGYAVLAAVTVPLLAIAMEGSAIATRPPRAGPAPKGGPPEPPPPPKCQEGTQSRPMPSTKSNAGLPPTPPEEPTISPSAQSGEFPAPPAGGSTGGGGTTSSGAATSGGAPIQPQYAPSWNEPLSPSEFQEWAEWTKANRAYAEQEAAAARERYRAARQALDDTTAASEAADAEYQQVKTANPDSAEAQAAFEKRVAAQRAQLGAQEAAYKAQQEYGRKTTESSKAQTRADYPNKIGDANQRLYQAKQAYDQATQKFQDWVNENPRASTCGPDPAYEAQWDQWYQAKSAWQAEQSAFYKQSMSSGAPTAAPSAGENPTDPANVQPGPSPAAAPAPPAASGADLALEKTQPQPADPALDKTQPQPAPTTSPLAKTLGGGAGAGAAGPDPALDKTQPQPAPTTSPLAKTLGGVAGAGAAIKGGGQ